VVLTLGSIGTATRRILANQKSNAVWNRFGPLTKPSIPISAAPLFAITQTSTR
jgi:hypothetical protein